MSETTDFAAALAKHPFAQGMSDEEIDRLASCVEGIHEYAEDQVIFRSGGEARHCYLIVEGEVAIEIHSPGSGSRIVMTVARGQVLGWSWLFEPYRTTFAARVLTPAKAIVLDGARLRETMEQEPELGYALLLRIARMIGGRLQATRLQLLDLYASRD